MKLSQSTVCSNWCTLACFHLLLVLVRLKREPRSFPTLKIVRQVTDINDFKLDDFKLSGYTPLPKIKMDMAV